MGHLQGEKQVFQHGVLVMRHERFGAFLRDIISSVIAVEGVPVATSHLVFSQAFPV